MVNSPQPRFQAARVLAAVAAGLGIGMLLAAVWIIASFLPQRSLDNDFALAYLPGHILRHGQDPYLTDLNAYNQQLGKPFTAQMGPATNPPLLVLLFAQLARLTPRAAFWIWVVVQVLSVVAIYFAGWLLLRDRLGGAWLALAAGLSAFSWPMFSHFWFSQIQLPIAALLLIGFWLWTRNWRFVACGLWTLAAALKLYPVVVVVYPILISRGRARFIWLVSVAGWLTLWGLLPGVGLWQSFIKNALPYLTQLASGRYYDFTVLSFVTGLTAQPLIGQVLAAAVFLIAVGVSLRYSDASSHCHEAIFCLLIVCSILCSVIAWTHYFVLLFYPLCWLASRLRVETAAPRWLIALTLLVNLFALNTAGINLAPTAPSQLRFLLNELPVFALICVYGMLLWLIIGLFHRWRRPQSADSAAGL